MKNDFNYTAKELEQASTETTIIWAIAVILAVSGLVAILYFAANGGDVYVPQIQPFSCGK